MKNISDIKHRMKGISDTRKITGAMETISVAKMQKALLRYENNKAYFENIRKTISNIVLYTRNVEHKVFLPSNESRAAFIVIASDKGLAGGFNHDVLEFARSEIRNYTEPRLFAVGHVCCEYFSARKFPVDEAFADASFDPSVLEAAELSDKLYKLFASGEIDSAYIIFTAMENGNKMQPQKIKLLPFDRNYMVRAENSPREEYVTAELEYEPSAEEVLDMLMPQYLTGMIYGALIQSSACEHCRRRSAMNTATTNASQLLDNLALEYNRARQEKITGELAEIITAFNGVQQ